MAYYETVFIARQDISQPQAEALGDAFAKVIGDMGGKVPKREYWGLRNLSFRIKKNRKGHYMLLNLDAPAAAVHEMERQMRINEDIVRFLTVRVEELEEGPSAIMKAKDQRDERPSRGFGGGFGGGGFGGGGFGGGGFGGDRDRSDRPPRRPRDEVVDPIADTGGQS